MSKRPQELINKDSCEHNASEIRLRSAVKKMATNNRGRHLFRTTIVLNYFSLFSVFPLGFTLSTSFSFSAAFFFSAVFFLLSSLAACNAFF